MIQTWQQRCLEHLDHGGIVTHEMIRDRMQEEIDELRQAPPRKEWTGLSNDDIWEIYKKHDSMQYREFARAIEAKLKEKNHG